MKPSSNGSLGALSKSGSVYSPTVKAPVPVLEEEEEVEGRKGREEEQEEEEEGFCDVATSTALKPSRGI